MDHQNKLGFGTRGTFRRARGILVLGSLATTAGLLVWAGCSSSSSGGGSDNTVDPGGTYGAEISIKVVGRGSVSSKLAGINCPGQCFARYAFKSAADVGATTGVTLTARVTSDKVRFVGWSLEPAPLATRGRGPDSCNPVTRDSAVPAIDANASDVTLPFGTVQGRPPVGQEAACSGFTDVPTAYSLTATFEDIPVPDAGVDADDGGGPDLLYDRPIVNSQVVADAVGKEIGVPTYSSGYLFWRWQNSQGKSGISYAYTFGGGQPTVVVQPTKAITIMGIDSQVVYQTDDGVLHFIQPGGNLPVDLAGAPPCVAVASDSSNVYCRTASTGSNGALYRWSTSSQVLTQIFDNLPTGNDLYVDTYYGYVYMTDTAGGAAGAARIVYTPQTADGGLSAAFNQLVVSQTSPFALRGAGTSSTGRIHWLQSLAGGAQGWSAASKTGQSLTPTPVFGATAGINRLAVYTGDYTYFYVATASEISKAYAYGGSPLTLIRGGINNVGGLAVDSSYVYWTAADGRVFRRYKN